MSTRAVRGSNWTHSKTLRGHSTEENQRLHLRCEQVVWRRPARDGVLWKESAEIHPVTYIAFKRNRGPVEFRSEKLLFE